MNSIPLTLVFTATVVASSLTASALTFTWSDLRQNVPDHSTAGLINSQTVTAPGSIESLTVHLSLSGAPGFNGDLFAYLRHGTGYAVLLNRVGRDASNPSGYDDNGFDVTFADGAPNIHDHRLSGGGSATTPVDPGYLLPLTGTWAPDGRTSSPLSVLSSDLPTATLAAFVGLPIAGTWDLFVADLGAGGTFRLDGWSLNIIPKTDPPVSVADGGLLGIPLGLSWLILMAWGRRTMPSSAGRNGAV